MPYALHGYAGTHGRTGMLKTVADGFHPGSEVANMSVMGYDPAYVYEGRGVLEAASIGVDLEPRHGDALQPGMHRGRYPEEPFGRAHHTEEADELIRALEERLGSEPYPFLYRRAIPAFAGGESGNKHVACVPPHGHPVCSPSARIW